MFRNKPNKSPHHLKITSVSPATDKLSILKEFSY